VLGLKKLWKKKKTERKENEDILEKNNIEK